MWLHPSSCVAAAAADLAHPVALTPRPQAFFALGVSSHRGDDDRAARLAALIAPVLTPEGDKLVLAYAGLGCTAAPVDRTHRVSCGCGRGCGCGCVAVQRNARHHG